MAQKKLHRTILDDGINLIQINAANCYKVEVETGTGKELQIEGEIEGEYLKDLDVKFSTIGTTISVEAGFNSDFENPNDKLSAHKVVSISLKLIIPVFKQVELYGTNARVVVSGSYEDLSISLSDGICELDNVLGNIFVHTQSGSIKVFTKAAVIEADSKYGKVGINLIPQGNSKYELHTITGNIELIKTE